MKEYLNKKNIEQSFAGSYATYDQYAKGQSVAASYLIELLQKTSDHSVEGVLEIGCGTGLLTEKLVGSFEIQHLYLNDLAANLCQTTSNKVGTKVHEVTVLAGDAEKIDLPEAIDLCVSSSTLQWFCDIEAFVQRISNVLNPGGMLAIALCGEGTMHEIKALTGRGLHYHSLSRLTDIVKKTLHIEYTEEVREQYYFPSVWAVLKHIKNTGVGAVQGNQWDVGRLRQFEKDYRIHYGGERGIPVSFTTLYLVATKKQ